MKHESKEYETARTKGTFETRRQTNKFISITKHTLIH